MSTAMVKTGLGDPLSDTAAVLSAAVTALRQSLSTYQNANSNDLVLQQVLQNEKSVETAVGGYAAAVGALQASLTSTQAQLQQCLAAQAAASTTAPASATTAPVVAPAAGISPVTVSFVAIGSALLGGVAGFNLRGRK
jgi:hypothetical protein